MLILTMIVATMGTIGVNTSSHHLSVFVSIAKRSNGDQNRLTAILRLLRCVRVCLDAWPFGLQALCAEAPALFEGLSGVRGALSRV